MEPFSEYKVYPNPVSSILKVESPSETGHMKIYDLTGKELMSIYLNGRISEFDISSLQNGVYWINLDGSLTKKIIIQH